MSPARVKVLRCGSYSSAIFGRPSGRVAAKFEHSLYLEADGEFLCVGAASIGNGPLNAIVGESDFRVLRRTLSIGETYLQHGRQAACLTGLELSFADAAIWQPARTVPLSAEWSAAELFTLSRRLENLLPEDGLARIIFGTRVAETSPIATMAQPAIDALRAVLRAGATNSEPESEQIDLASRLIGLGPGLTPSGDDVIGGALIALRAAGKSALADALWSAFLPRAAKRTSPLALAHLKAAAAGHGAEAVHNAMNDLFLGRSFKRLAVSVGELGKVGHTSGFDGFAGVILAVESWVAPQGP